MQQQYNPFAQMMDMMQNPAQSMLDRAKEDMRMRNPDLYRKAEEMVEGKSPDQLKQTALNLAKERGIDLGKFAQQFGIRL